MIRIIIRLFKVIKKYNSLVNYIEKLHAYMCGSYSNCSLEEKENFKIKLDILVSIKKFIDKLEEHDDGKI